MARRYSIKSRPNSWVERGKDGKFKNWTNKGRSIQEDRRIHAKKVVKAGYGHLGDQKPRIRYLLKAKVGREMKTLPRGSSARQKSILKKASGLFAVKMQGRKIIKKVKIS